MLVLIFVQSKCCRHVHLSSSIKAPLFTFLHAVPVWDIASICIHARVDLSRSAEVGIYAFLNMNIVIMEQESMFSWSHWSVLSAQSVPIRSVRLTSH